MQERSNESPKSKTVQAPIPIELYTQVVTKAKELDLSISWVVRNALKKYFNGGTQQN
jgi:hypothetical protein